MTARPDLDAGALMVDAALSYAHRGWLVLPIHSVDTGRCTCGRADCASPAKHPLTRRGLKDASADPQVIERWWRRWPRANVAVRTGQESGLLVLDFDPRNGGDESLAALVYCLIDVSAYRAFRGRG